jgi:AAA family ATP:ADP antiporter
MEQEKSRSSSVLFCKGFLFFLFPIQKKDFSKFFSLIFLFIFISFNYNLLHCLKDILVLNYTNKVEVLPYLKMYLVTPAIVFMIYMYMKLSRITNIYNRFNFVVLYFFLVISLLHFVFIPNLDFFKLDFLSDLLSKKIPSMNYLWEMIRFWPISLLYINGEAWSSIVLAVSFWNLANDISSFDQAGRIYSSIASFGSAIGCITAGIAMKNDFIKNDFNQGLRLVCYSMFLMLLLFNILRYKNIFKSSISNDRNFSETKNQKKKVKLIQSIKIIYKSKNLIYIVTMVLGYNLFIYLFESIWKNQVLLYSKQAGKESLAVIYGDQSMLIGILVLFFGFFSTFIKKKGWKFTAMITPLISLFSTLVFCFFLSENFIDFFNIFFDFDRSKLLYFSVLFGLINTVVVKASKYVLFDSTKEQAYIPLSMEEKIEGKSAIDGFFSRIGKSLGGFILSTPYVGLINIFGDLYKGRWIIFFIMILVLILWIKSIKKLSFLIKSKV